MRVNHSHPYHWPTIRFRLEVQRLAALGEFDALLALAAAHLGAEWQGMTPTESDKREAAA